jgi:uncharacterized protein (TIGR03437 family)
MMIKALFRSRPAEVVLRHFALLPLMLCFLAVVGGNPAHAQNALLCTPLASPVQVRSEGIAEKVGNIVLSCSGGIPGTVVTGNLTFFLSVNVTNKLAADGTLTDVLLTINTGNGPTPVNVAAQPFGNDAVVFNGVTFTVPPSGSVTLQLSNLRGDASQLGPTPEQAITANVAVSGSQGMAIGNNAEFAVGFTMPGLLATFSSNGVTCSGSPLPQLLNIGNLFAVGTRFFSTRITEGFAAAFQVKDAFSDTGTRVMVSYSNFPAGARLFVPDFVAGSDAVVPTSGGDLGLLPSGGTYQPTANGSLLLILVSGADQNGAGGSMILPKPALLTPFNQVTEVPLTNGVGTAVYEVADTNPNVRETAQFPTFLGLAPFGGGASTTASVNLSFAPVSTVHVAADAPVPRFVNVAPPSDCSALGDCTASYFPHLRIDAPAGGLNFAAAQNAFLQTGYIEVQNSGQGELDWTASVTYQTGSGWLVVDPASGINDGTIRIDAHPEKVPPGTYQATLTVNAGLAGSQTFPVTFTVTGPGLGGPLVTSVFNAASLQPGPLVAGSLAAVFGSGFTGEQVSVTFGGNLAPIIYKSATQINLQVPAAVAGETSSQMVVMVDGHSSAPQAVTLAAAAPGIFNPGVLNQNNTLNTAANPAARGTTIEILCTGLISPASDAVSAVIAGQTINRPLSSGSLAGVPGVQQVTVTIPTGIPAGATQVEVCAVAAGTQPVCSMPASVMVK